MLGIGAVLLVGSCASTPKVTSDFDASANFATYQTLAVMQREHPGIPPALVATRTAEDISQELQRKGYTPAADPTSANFMVDFTIGAQERKSLTPKEMQEPAEPIRKAVGSTLARFPPA